MERLSGRPAIGGVVGWLIAKFGGREHRESRLALVERIALAPRQSLALVEAEGRRILVATSAEGGPAFYSLDASPRDLARSARMGQGRAASARSRRQANFRAQRVSW